MKPSKAALVGAFLAVVAPSACFCGEIVFVRGSGANALAQWQMELSARYYGLQVREIALHSPADGSSVLALFRQRDTLAAVVAADALPGLRRAEVLAALRRPGRKRIPLLVLGITPQSDPKQLAQWSSGALQGCTALDLAEQGYYGVAPPNEVTRELAGQELPNLVAPECGLSSTGAAGTEALFVFRQGQGDNLAFARVVSFGESTFFLSQMKTVQPLKSSASLRTEEVFSRLAPILLFMKYAAGDRAWHSPGRYANLTIDDAWLTKSYGHLDYATLLQEMEKHNFHTTVAFIPWNFDRSEQDVVRLFRDHSDRFSISIHGDNHDHREFVEYEKVSHDRQISDIKQAIARMDLFYQETGIPYDRVMVFPQGIAPEPTLADLKRYNFLATVNSEFIPLGARVPDDPLFFLGSVTLRFADFPSLLRYPAKMPRQRLLLAVDAFLGDPFLFYGHEDLFANGIDAFDGVADAVNHVAPDTSWKDLGYIARHLYRSRLREDQNYDLELFSSEVDVANPSRLDTTFFVRKQENSIPPITSLMVNGQVQPFRLAGDDLSFSLRVRAGGSAHIKIDYKNDLQATPADTSKRSLYVAVLRRASDFRDITLSKYAAGRGLTRFIYKFHLNALDLKLRNLFPVWLLILLPLVYAIWHFRGRVRAKKSSNY